MNISPVQPIAFAEVSSSSQSQEPASRRAELIQAVKAVNDSNALGDNNELTFVLDRNSHRTLTRVIDRKTQEVVMQIPPDYVLRLAEQIKRAAPADDR